jgi:TonB-linked SusC/RagA family outer membrane protein
MNNQNKKPYILSGLILMLVVVGWGTASAQTVKKILYSQNKNLSHHQKNAVVPLAKVLKKIGRTHHITFLYQSDLLKGKKVSKKVLNSSDLTHKVGKLLAHEGLTYEKQAEGTYVIKRLPGLKSSLRQVAQHEVKGTVTDAQTGDPLAGVNILVIGTSTGTSTDNKGHYSLNVSSLQDTLRFSYIGYQTKTVAINGRNTIEIKMQPTTVSGQQMVVVGYTQQNEQNITGAVTKIPSKKITSRPMTNLNQGLQGVAPNVNIDNENGKPFASPTINVRGETSIGEGGNALILIDGVEGDPSMVNPKDIKSISVLKGPAASAEYGSRAAFGVIQITTKSGVKKGFSVHVGSHVGFKQPAKKPGFVTDGYTYVKNFAKAYRNALGTTPTSINKTQPFSEDYLEEFKKHHENPSLPEVEVDKNGNYVYYASTDWYHKLYKDKLLNQQYNFSASAGNGQSNFILSGRYQGQDGLFRYNSDNYNMYNLRGKGSIQLFSWLKATDNFSFNKRIYRDPLNVAEGGGIWRNIMDEGHPSAPMLNPDGSITFSGVYTVGDFYYGKNRKDFQNQILNNKIQLEGDFLKDQLSIIGNFSFQNQRKNVSEKRVPVPYSKTKGEILHVGENQNWLGLTPTDNNYMTLNFYGEYKSTLGRKNNVDFTIGTNYEKKRHNRFYLQRNGLAFPDAENINLALGDKIESNGGYNEWKTFGAFYQLNYNYDERYLLTLSGRYDGNSKFPETQRYGFFPSFSAGWMISQEPFWHISNKLISELKIRGSYGSLGNGNVSPYTYQEELQIHHLTNIIDGNQPQYTEKPTPLPNGLTWETVTTSDVGLDLGMFSGRLKLKGDAYIRKTKNMFTHALTPPRVFGASTPNGNYADLKTKGWGAELSWTDYLDNVGGKKFGYSIDLNISDNTARITRFNNPNKNLDDYYVGEIIGEKWGYVTQGIFQSKQQVKNHAKQDDIVKSFGSPDFGVGDLMYKDLNGDGKINDGENTVDHPGDRRIIGNVHPRYRFGINIKLNWGGGYISGFFQGVGKEDWYPSPEADYFWGQYNRPYNQLPKWQLKKGVIWSKDNPNGFLPKYNGYEANASNRSLGTTQTRYMMNVAYIRLKNLQIGYNFSSKQLSSVGIQKVRIYLNGQNLWEYTPLQKTAPNIDPENGIVHSESDVSGGVAGQGLNYPMLRSESVGFSITF